MLRRELAPAELEADCDTISEVVANVNVPHGLTTDKSPTFIQLFQCEPACHSIYCAAFTSFQISLYLARRGTFCQK
jgi:hypothetical protein